MYVNNIKERPHASRVYPYIMSKLCDYFSFEQSRFSMNRSKEGTARIAMLKELGIPNIFTMEASFCGADMGALKDTHFTTDALQMAGKKCLEALIVYSKIEVKHDGDKKGRANKEDKTDQKKKVSYMDFNAEDMVKELTQNKQLIKMTMGEEGNSSGSDSEPSADNMDEDELAKITPIKMIKKAELKKKEDKKPPMPKKLEKPLVKKP